MLIICIDRRQEARASDFRLPVLAVALGIYLPLKLSATIFLGGVIATLASRGVAKSTEVSRRGLLCSAGLITGEALMGILLAFPIGLSALWPGLNPDPFTLFEAPPIGGWPGLVIMALVGWQLYRIATEHSNQKTS